MHNISVTGLMLNICLKAPIVGNSYSSFSLKNSQLSRFTNSFLISSKSVNIENSKFDMFLKSPFILEEAKQFKIHHKKKFTNSYSSQSDNFTKCTFVRIRAHAIFCYDISGYLSLSDCHFENCSTNDPEPESSSSSGGAVFSVNSNTKILTTTFIGCYTQGYGHAFSLDCASSAFCSNSKIYYCHPFQINYADSAHMKSDNSVFEYSNITLSESQSNAGLLLNSKSSGRVFCINIANVTGASILSISSPQPAEFGNIISCDSNSGIIHSELKDITISKFCFDQNVGPLDSRESKYIIVFVDCIFKDHNKPPKGKRIAIQGTFCLNGNPCTDYIFPKQRKNDAAKKEEKQYRTIGILLLIASSLLGCAFLYTKCVPLYLNVKEGIEEEKNAEKHNEVTVTNNQNRNVVNRFQYN